MVSIKINIEKSQHLIVSLKDHNSNSKLLYNSTMQITSNVDKIRFLFHFSFTSDK